ncbi:MAG: hypothetical protein ACHQCE_11220, partial [Streptosporangiales bacterium]
TYGSLVTYAAEAGVPVILDAGGDELKHAVGHGPDLVVAESSAAEAGSGGFGAALIRLGAAAAAAAVAVGGRVHAVTPDGEWTARVDAADDEAAGACFPLARGALVAGLVPGQLLGWSWPDRLRHALALATGGAGSWTSAPGGPEERDRVDLAAYERLLDAVRVTRPARGYFKELLSDHSECARSGFGSPTVRQISAQSISRPQATPRRPRRRTRRTPSRTGSFAYPARHECPRA